MRTIGWLCTFMWLACAASAQESTAPVIVTTGEGLVRSAPDVAFVTLAVETRAKSPRDAQRQNAEAIAAIARRLTELSIPPDARRTTAVALVEDYDNVNGRRVSRGFIARNEVEVRVDDISRAGEVADAVVQAGATSLNGIRFDLKDRSTAERQAIRLAVADARAKADAAAAGAGRNVDRILKIEEGERAGVPQPMMRTLAARAENITVVEPGLIDTRAIVTLTVAMK